MVHEMATVKSKERREAHENTRMDGAHSVLKSRKATTTTAIALVNNRIPREPQEGHSAHISLANRARAIADVVCLESRCTADTPSSSPADISCASMSVSSASKDSSE